MRKRVRLNAPGPSEETRRDQAQSDHDHDATDPEPMHVAGHEAARDVAEPLPGEDPAGEQDQQAHNADGSPHGVAFCAGLPDPAEDDGLLFGVLEVSLDAVLLAEP